MNMNKKLLSAAVLAGLAGGASAVNVNSDGTGELLLFPYYTVNDGNATHIFIVNTTANTKAVKVRFNEGGNSWEVKDFNLYLSPYDVWSGAVTMAADGSAPMVSTEDTSCTAPKVYTYAEANANATYLADQSFDTVNIDTFSSSENSTIRSVSAANRIKEGYIEVIEMGEIWNSDGNNSLPYGTTQRMGNDGLDLPGYIEHSNGVPNDCDKIREAWESGFPTTSQPWYGLWSSYSNGRTWRDQLSAPAGGLFGIGAVINVQGAVQRSYDATALQNVYARPMHSRPGTAYPDLGGSYLPGTSVVGGNVLTNANQGLNQVTAAIFMPGATPAARLFGFSTRQDNVGNDVQDAGWATIQAITAALQVDRVNNVFTNNSGMAAVSDWVVTFPTKHEFLNISTTQNQGKLGKEGYSGLTRSNAPFNVGGFNIGYNMWLINNEEDRGDVRLDFSPSGNSSSIPFETNVLSFADTAVFNSNYSASVPTGNISDGWAQLRFTTRTAAGGNGLTNGYDNYELCEDTNSTNQALGVGTIRNSAWGTNAAGTGPKCLVGLPVIGFGTTQIYNGTRSYSTLYNHKFGRLASL